VCEGCPIAGRLKCRFNRGDLLHFIGLFAGFALPAIIGVIRGGYGWYLLGWAAFCLVFFEFWEIRILCSHCPYYAEKGLTLHCIACSHCPYYAEKGLTLHCIANYGSLKVWRYHPEPISKAETVQLVIGFILLCGYPFVGVGLVLLDVTKIHLLSMCELLLLFEHGTQGREGRVSQAKPRHERGMGRKWLANRRAAMIAKW